MLGEEPVEIGEVEEVLTDNGQLALHGALWELDQDIGQTSADQTTRIWLPLCLPLPRR